MYRQGAGWVSKCSSKVSSDGSVGGRGLRRQVRAAHTHIYTNTCMYIYESTAVPGKESREKNKLIDATCANNWVGSWKSHRAKY